MREFTQMGEEYKYSACEANILQGYKYEDLLMMWRILGLSADYKINLMFVIYIIIIKQFEVDTLWEVLDPTVQQPFRKKYKY
jgi:hypothetical protein